MEKKKGIYIWLSALVLLGSAGWGALAAAPEWRFMKDLGISSADLARVELEAEIFSSARRDLGDLRIFDSKEKQIPYRLIKEEGVGGKEHYQARMFDSSFVSNQWSEAIFDLGKDEALTSAVTFSTEQENFQRTVQVDASSDLKEWRTLTDKAYAFDYTDKKANIRVKGYRVSYPESAARYIRLRIDASAGEPVRILGASFEREMVQWAREITRPATLVSEKKNESTKSTEILADLGVSGVPAGKISFSVSDKNFKRSFSILTSDSLEMNDARTVGYGYIFRFDTAKFQGESLSADIASAEPLGRYVKIVLRNEDNEPLAVSALDFSYAVRSLVFPAKSGERYALYYGNPEAAAPRYDLDTYFAYLDTDKTAQLKTSQEKINPDYKEPKDERPLSERSPFLLPAALVLAALLLGLLVTRFIRN